MRKSTLVGVLGAGTVVAFAIGGPGWTSPGLAAATPAVTAPQSGPAPAEAVEPEEVTFKVEGMTCGGCAIATRTVLERLDGVDKAEVSYENGEAVVVYDPQTVSVREMIQAVKELGYTATVVESQNG